MSSSSSTAPNAKDGVMMIVQLSLTTLTGETELRRLQFEHSPAWMTVRRTVQDMYTGSDASKKVTWSCEFCFQHRGMAVNSDADWQKVLLLLRRETCGNRTHEPRASIELTCTLVDPELDEAPSSRKVDDGEQGVILRLPAADSQPLRSYLPENGDSASALGNAFQHRTVARS